MSGLNKKFSEWWNSDVLLEDNPYSIHTPMFWAWEGWVAGVRVEREACAKVCEAGTGKPIQMKTLDILRKERERIAAAIRARGQE